MATQVNALEDDFVDLSDAELRVADQETKDFAERVKMMF